MELALTLSVTVSQGLVNYVPPLHSPSLLLESGDYLLLESGDTLLLE